MNKAQLEVLPCKGPMTFFCFETSVHTLCRSADWYNFLPIQRYLMNMAANIIRMEDAKTETREYTPERFQLLTDLLHDSERTPAYAALQAWELWGKPDLAFGVVHLDQEDGKRGDLLLGDDPLHCCDFADAAGLIHPGENSPWPIFSIEGSNV